MHTRSSIRKLLRSNRFAVERAIYVLFLRQTQDEQEFDTTVEKNRQGFSFDNADDGCRMGKIIDAYANGDPDFMPEGILADEDMPRALEIAEYHARQLADIANSLAVAA